ncbi:hypothetical protein K432DRAFT_305513 [Lepidopterella palustris CBS 459.81]|uniref:Uncharacterized protein n=1 Tax=Lepidopterella palustris CBS 459.81 TaxID=1314670 RepID=A0A8E2E402_9PEZI|nr:hypothetical protein K432DRAFT_305513 [Lepidopterella palustris CBS 459.81]
MVLAASKSNVAAALKFLSKVRGGLPTLEQIRATPSQSLSTAYQSAKKAALEENKTTILGVSLTDVHIFELESRGTSEPWFSFAHSFTMGVAPEGLIIWQAWGEHGYRLDEWVARDGSRLRSWDEGDSFVRDFERLVSGKGVFNAKRNMLYKRCFDVDIFKICGPKGPERPVVPKFEAWIRLHVLEDVKVEDIAKFTFSKGEFVG